jgi:glutamate-5-semialdehyde dehydrogenase
MSALESATSVSQIMAEIGRNARLGAKALATATPEQKRRALTVAAGAINAHRKAILAANALDMSAAEAKAFPRPSSTACC